MLRVAVMDRVTEVSEKDEQTRDDDELHLLHCQENDFKNNKKRAISSGASSLTSVMDSLKLDKWRDSRRTVVDEAAWRELSRAEC